MANLDHKEQVGESEHIDTTLGPASSDALPGTWEYDIKFLQTNTEKEIGQLRKDFEEMKMQMRSMKDMEKDAEEEKKSR